MFRGAIDLDSPWGSDAASTPELARLRLLNSKLRSQSERLKAKNAQLERARLEIVYKMKSLREIQMRSELSRKLVRELDDLETIVEDSELFLESAASPGVSELPFMGKSVGSLTTLEDLDTSSESVPSEVLFEPVLAKLAALELPALGEDELEKLCRELASAKSSVEFCILLSNGLEGIFDQLNVQMRFLLSKNEQMTARLGQRDDRYEELLRRTRRKNEEFQELLNSALDTNKRLQGRQKNQCKAVKREVKKKYKARLNRVIDVFEQQLQDQRVRRKFRKEFAGLRAGKSQLRLTIEDFSQVSSCRAAASDLATSVEASRKSDKLKSFGKKLKPIGL